MYNATKSKEIFTQRLQEYLDFLSNVGKNGVSGGVITSLFDFGQNNYAQVISMKSDLLAMKEVLGLSDKEVQAIAYALGYKKEPIVIADHRHEIVLKSVYEQKLL
ncbi:MAG: hypothetical protein PHH83_04510 [Patescibacteria group bacterium]|nr:hypothetical protein [Patescibacteria group bacterium]